MNIFHAISVAGGGLPRLTLAQRVVDTIVRNAQNYATETGESLVGFAMNVRGRPEPDLVVIDTIAPDVTAVRHEYMFVQGDDLQGDIFHWWALNWDLMRKQNSRWDVPLLHLGNWHKHPETMTAPSGGDHRTAYDDIFDDVTGSPQLLTLLATLWDSRYSAADEQADQDAIWVAVEGNKKVRIDCWYMSRNTRRFVPVTPEIVPDSSLPSLPVIGWHIANPDRMRQEIDALKREGYDFISMKPYDADGLPPLEVCLPAAKRTGHHILIAVTAADYPASRPAIRVTPMSALKEIEDDTKLFLRVWEKSEPLAVTPPWNWTPDRKIVDLFTEAEAMLAKKATSHTT